MLDQVNERSNLLELATSIEMWGWKYLFFLAGFPTEDHINLAHGFYFRMKLINGGDFQWIAYIQEQVMVIKALMSSHERHERTGIAVQIPCNISSYSSQ